MQTSAQRLKAAKENAAKMAEKYGKGSHYSDWRNVRSRPFASKHHGGTWKQDYTGPKSDRPYFCDNFDSFRDHGDAHDNTHLNHTGWFCDIWENGVIRGRVLQLPSRTGDPIYIPATYCTDWDGVTIYPLDQYDDPAACASVADGYAEQEAEKGPKYSAKDAAEQQIEQLHDEAKEAIRDFAKLKTAIKGKTYGDPVCGVIREKLGELREIVSARVSRIGELKDDPWLAA